MRKPIIVIKLGGSALTDKSRIYTPRISTIHRAASQIAVIAKKFSVMLVHGAGSFGHISVEKYGLAHGFKSRRQLKGLARTKFKLLEWESMLDEILLRHKIPLMPFVTSSFVVAKKGRIVSADLEPLRGCLRLGCVPSAGGDVVTDLDDGFSIVSGDQLAAYVAVKLRASSLIFGIDVDGIFDSDPKVNKRAQLLERMRPSFASKVVSRTEQRTTPDVTGGMAGKIKEAAIAARHGVPVCFVNLTKPERLEKAAFNRPVLCSKIVAE